MNPMPNVNLFVYEHITFFSSIRPQPENVNVIVVFDRAILLRPPMKIYREHNYLYNYEIRL